MASGLFFSGIGVIGFAGGAALLRVYQIKRVDFVSISLASISLFHGVFLMLCLIGARVELNSIFNDIAFYEPYALHYFFIVIAFVMMMLCGANVSIWKRAIRTRPSLCKQLSKSNAMKLSIAGWILLSSSIFFYWLYCQAYGGFISILLNARYIKAGLFDIGPQGNPWSFLGKLGGFSFMASFIFWGGVLAQKNWRSHVFSFFNLMGLFFSFIFSICVIFTWYSRSHLVFYVSAFLFSSILHKSLFRINYKMFKAILLMILLLFSLFFLSSYLTKGVRFFEGEIERFKLDASVRILPIFYLLENNEYRWFQDIFYIPFYFLPQRLWRGNLVSNTASEIMTIEMVGAKKGENGVKGAMVIGIIPFSFLQLGFLGVLLIGFFWGGFLKNLDRWLLFNLPPGLSETVYAYLAFRFVVSSVWGADPQVVIYNHLDVFLSLLFVLIIQRLSIKSFR